VVDRIRRARGDVPESIRISALDRSTIFPIRWKIFDQGTYIQATKVLSEWPSFQRAILIKPNLGAAEGD